MRAARRWDLWGGAAGLVLGGVDLSAFFFFGAVMRVGGVDVTLPLSLFYWLTFGALGWAVGRVFQARERARRDARTITAQLRALEESQRAALQNEKLAAIGRMAAGVAHEVRNPLGVIRASAAMVQERFAPGEEPHRACTFILEEIDRLNGVIVALLSLARPTEPRCQPTSIESVLDRALQLAAAETERRGIAVERRLVSALPELRADPDLLAQAVLDLVVNAAEALGKGGRIAVRAAAQPNAVEFEVADSGPGIPAEEAHQVFEPFFTTKPSGTGLGLAMVARIVQAHGGHIELRPSGGLGERGSGACFRARLPLGGPLAAGAAS